MNIDRQPNMHDLSWFIDMDKQGRLELDPPYQRKSVWTPSDRYYFLDTIFNNYPCPAIYVQKEITAAGPKYNVVDGKQRLATVLNFYNNKFQLPKNFEIRRLAGKRFKNLEGKDIVDFYNYVFLVETLKASVDAEWNEIFFRVNKNQKGLTEQELRHARYSGWFITRAEGEIDDSPKRNSNNIWSSLKISTTAKSKRMKDVEFVSILMLVILERKFVGFPQSDIDELYAKYDIDLARLPTEDSIAAQPDFDDLAEGGDSEGDELEAAAAVVLKEDIDRFEDNFEKIKKYVLDMEAHNNCITNHTRRLTTDFYSLWAVLALTDKMEVIPPQKFAEIYSKFIDGVDEIYDAPRRSQPVEDAAASADPMISKYYFRSIGAATTEESRRLRDEAFRTFVDSQLP